MKNTKFIPGASKAEEKGKRHPSQKKKENHFEFFSLRQVSTKKRNQKDFQRKQRKWMKIWKA
jgi:hypothetical protein